MVGDTPTTWVWNIVPKHSGNLHLHLAAIVEIKQLSRDFTTIDREIAVQVDPVDATERFIQTNWQWTIATLTAEGGATWKLIREEEGRDTGAAVCWCCECLGRITNESHHSREAPSYKIA